MGEPNATEMPEAAAADSTSLFRAEQVLRMALTLMFQTKMKRTFIVVDGAEQLDEDIGTAAGNVNEGSLLAQPHARCDGEDLQVVQQKKAEGLARVAH
jgi:hypothetical protein